MVNASQIQEHMEIKGSDGQHVGTVDRVEGDRIKLTKSDKAARGEHHYMDLAAVREVKNGCVVVSCFANPHEFASLDEGDHGRQDVQRDMALLEREATDIVFRPSVAELYPADDLTRVSVEGLTRQLEGASRPGHLDGLTTVMLKLINLVGPARVYLGQKHAQQVVILRRMMRDLFMNVELVVCPTVRESDGLAMSSANARLSIEERVAAT